jgi:hypothetical protein
MLLPRVIPVRLSPPTRERVLTAESREAAVCFLTHLLKSGGEWRSSTELDEMEGDSSCNDHIGVRWDRILKKLPQRIQSLIETNRKKGNRLRPAAWRR